MKNRKFLLGVLVIVLTFGMTVIGCDDNEETEDHTFAGTWVSMNSSTGYKEAQIVSKDEKFTASTFKASTSESSTTFTEKKFLEGTYSLGTSSPLGRIVTLTITRVNVGESTEDWKNWGELTVDQITQMKLPQDKNIIGLVFRTTFTITTDPPAIDESSSFTKQQQ